MGNHAKFEYILIPDMEEGPNILTDVHRMGKKTPPIRFNISLINSSVTFIYHMSFQILLLCTFAKIVGFLYLLKGICFWTCKGWDAVSNFN